MNVGDRRLARLLDAFPEIVVVLDAMGNVLWANHLAEVLFDRSLEDAIGMSGIDLVHPDDLEIVLRSLETVQSKSVGSPLEIRAKVGDDWRLIELIGTPVPWFEKGAVLFSIRDLTDRRRFELARDNVARFRSLVHNATTIMMFVSPTGDVESVSGAMTRMLGHDPETVERQPLANIVAPADRPALRVAIETALRSSSATQPVVQALRLLRRGGDEMISYELSIVSLVDDPTVGGLVVTAHDVSARVTAEMELRNTVRELRETSSLLNATLESTADGLLVVGTDRTITSFNSQFAEMWRLPTNLVAARDDHRLLEYVAGQLVDPDAFMSRVLDLYAQPEVESDDTLEFIDGRVFQRLSKPQYVSGDVVGRVWSFSDITEQKRLENDLAHLAFHDALTGLANRALFHDRVNQALARVERSDNYVAVLILDLDNFKTINDSLGHSAGDELLNIVASTLVGGLRKSDTAARLGGDEFAVLIEDAPNRDEVMRMADRLMKTLRAPVTVAGQETQRDREHGHHLRHLGQHRRPTPAQRRPGHVPREGAGEGPHRGVPGPDARRGRATTGTRERPTPRGALRRVARSLPADLQPGLGRHRRLRSARPLAAPHPRTVAAEVLHPLRRGDRLHPEHRSIRAHRGVHPGAALAEPGPRAGGSA